MGELRRSYIVIEDVSLGARRSFRPFDEVETAGAEPPNLSISQAELSEREANRLRGQPGKIIAPNDVEMFLMEPVASNDGRSGDIDAHAEWGLKQVGALETEFTGEGVTVAVLDTGIDATHPAFAGVTLIEQDFSGSGNGDRKGHGTHCAGTIFGRPVDGKRIGVAPGITKAYIGKVFADPGSARPNTSGMVLQGLSWAILHEVDVISMSVGIDLTKTSERLSLAMNPRAADALTLQAYADLVRTFDALMILANRQTPVSGGVVVVAAAGNASHRPEYEITASLPANANQVISVAAVKKDGAGVSVTEFSNSFPQLCAPGAAIVSAQLGGGLSVKDGTSMACPHVAGLAALWWEKIRKTGLPHTAESVRVNLLHAASLHRNSIIGPIENDDYGAGLAFAP